MTSRRDIIKSRIGIAGILAYGKAPAICKSAISARESQFESAPTPECELYAEVTSAYGWNNVPISVTLVGESGTVTYLDGSVHEFTPDSLSYQKAVGTGIIRFSNDFTSISFGKGNDARSVIGFVFKNSALTSTPNLNACFYMNHLELEGKFTSIPQYGFRDCGMRKADGLTIDLRKTNIKSFQNYSFTMSNASSILLGNVTSLGFQAFAYSHYLKEISINSKTAPSLYENGQQFRDAGNYLPSGTQKVIKVPRNATGYDSSGWVKATTAGGTEGTGWEIQYVL